MKIKHMHYFLTDPRYPFLFSTETHFIQVLFQLETKPRVECHDTSNIIHKKYPHEIVSFKKHKRYLSNTYISKTFNRILNLYVHT